jgi:hypothetical protein
LIWYILSEFQRAFIFGNINLGIVGVWTIRKSMMLDPSVKELRQIEQIIGIGTGPRKSPVFGSWGS